MNGALVLAASLSEMNRSAIANLLHARFSQKPGDANDPVSLALQLLRPDSITRALSNCTNRELAALRDLRDNPSTESPDIESLREKGLVGVLNERSVAMSEVLDRFDDMLRERGLTPDILDQSSPQVADVERVGQRVSSDIDPSGTVRSEWFTTAFIAAQHSVLILRMLEHEPGKVARNAEFALTTRTRLGERLRISADEVKILLHGMRMAGLLQDFDRAGLTRSTQERVATASRLSHRWSQEAHPARWLELGAVVLRSMPLWLQASLDNSTNLSDAAAAVMPTRFPLLRESDRVLVDRFIQVTDQFGLTVNGELTDVAVALMSGDDEGALELTQAAFPDTVPGVYLQPDLSIVAPGPLEPTDGLQLLEIADITGPGLAATLQISEGSVIRALDSGWTTDRIRAILERLSLTGLPQPLDFLLKDVGARHGSLVVTPQRAGLTLTRITARDPAVLEAMIVDSNLRSLGLARATVEPTSAGTDRSATDSDALVSRVSPEHVHSILIDARYPATCVRKDLGERVSTSSCDDPETLVTTRQDVPPDWAVELAEVIESQTAAADGEHGNQQLLDLAVRSRTPLVVTAEARGVAKTFRLIPLSISNGRLRALDQDADLERTLPVSAITQVAAAETP